MVCSRWLDGGTQKPEWQRVIVAEAVWKYALLTMP